MKLDLSRLLFGRDAKTPPVLLAITPPRTGERTMLGVENALGSIAVPEPFSLEIAGDADGVSLMARCRDRAVVRQQLSIHYPQARVREVPEEEDPLCLATGEQAWSMTLSAGGPEYVPLRTFRDRDILDPGSDPLLAPIGAVSALQEGERVVSRLMLRSLGPDWSQPYQAKALSKPLAEPRDPSYTYQTKPLQTDGVTMAVLGTAALVALRGYLWWRDGEILKAVLLGLGVGAAVTLFGWGYWRWKRLRSRVHDPLMIQEKVSRIAFDAQLEVVAILPQQGTRERAEELLSAVASAYRHYDNPAGARFRVGKVRPVVPSANLDPAGLGLFAKRSILGVREVAALWHPPGERDETPLPWAPPLPDLPGTSTSPRTSSGNTPCTWPARAWASPPSWAIP